MNTKALMPSNSDPDTHPTAFLAPKTGNRTQKVTKYVIDPHCHIYNATDWQIAGALRGPLANEIENPFTRWMLKQLAVPVEKISRSFSLSAASELKRLSTWEKLEAAEAKKQMESYISDHLEWLAEQLERLLKGSVLEFGINAILGHGPTIFTRDNHEKFDRKFLLDAFRHCPDPDRPGKVETQLDKTGLASVPGLFIFLRHIMSPRFANLLQYQEGFTTGEGSLGIDMCFASLLDFDYWIGDDDHAESALPDQIDLMEKISALSNGYMQPIVPYNPWTDIEDNDDSIRLVEYAVRHKGFIGVKIYPQLGYYPNKNAEQEYPADGIHPYLPMLDEKLNHFFSVCRTLDVPVMAHSEESMGRYPSHKKLGGPEAWTTFFKCARNSGTRINLAHMGGELGGGRGPWGWTRDFARLMQETGAKYLYGDLGLWDELIDGDAQARNRIVNLLDDPVSNHETVADRCMFGTDWFMLTFTRPKPDYATKFLAALESANVEGEVLEKIFYQNAENLFKTKCIR